MMNLTSPMCLRKTKLAQAPQSVSVLTRPCRIRPLASSPHDMIQGFCNPAVCRKLSVPRAHSIIAKFKHDQASEAPTPSSTPTIGMLPRNILIAVDLSPESDIAVEWTVGNLLRAGDSLHLLHLVPGTSTDHLFSTPSGHMVRINDGMAEALEKVAHKNGTARVQQLYKHYKPYLELMKVGLHAHVVPLPQPANKTSMGHTLCGKADALNAAVVVVASHSHGGLTELIRGSVANWEVKHCDRPVVVLHDPTGQRKKKGRPEGIWSPAPAQPRQLVVAVDAGEASLTACQWILDNMYHTADCIHLVHVVPCLPLHAYMGDLWTSAGLEAPDVQERQQEEAELEARQWQENQAQTFRSILEKAGAQYTFDTAVLPTEDPVQAISGFICSKAEELQAAAVVMSHHEQSAFAEFFLGSVTSQVSHHCAQPVVVLHTRHNTAPQAGSA